MRSPTPRSYRQAKRLSDVYPGICRDGRNRRDPFPANRGSTPDGRRGAKIIDSGGWYALLRVGPAYELGYRVSSLSRPPSSLSSMTGTFSYSAGLIGATKRAGQSEPEIRKPCRRSLASSSSMRRAHSAVPIETMQLSSIRYLSMSSPRSSCRLGLSPCLQTP